MLNGWIGRFLFPLLIIVFAICLLFGLRNMFSLGLISDDWDTFRSVYLLGGKSFKDIWDFFMWQSGLGLFQRPYWILFMLPQLAIFEQQIWLYFLTNILLFTAICYIAYIVLIKHGLSVVASLWCILIYIFIPQHFTSLFWISSQMSLFGLLFGALAWLLLATSWNSVIRFIAGLIVLSFSIVLYELNISFVFISIVSMLYIALNKKLITDWVKALTNYRVILVLFTVVPYFIYRKALDYFISDITFVREANVSFKSNEMMFQFKTALYSIAGPDFIKYLTQTVRDYKQLSTVDDVLLLICIFVIFIGSMVFLTMKLKNTQYVQPNKIQELNGLFLMFFIMTILPVLLTKYNYNVGGIDDRLNLSVSLFFSIFLTTGIFCLFKRFSYAILASMLVVFYVADLIVVGRFIHVNNTQQAFLRDIAKIEIAENTLFNLTITPLAYKGIPVFNTIWGNSYMISNIKNIRRIETDFNPLKLTNNNEYPSRLDEKYIFKDPIIRQLEFSYD